MKKELIQEYAARISQCNRSSLIVIVYEIILEYIKDCEIVAPCEGSVD